MLLVDGVKYKLWTPKDEEKEFHPLVKASSKEIFGEELIALSSLVWSKLLSVLVYGARLIYLVV
jgi:hypothetical protein